MASAFDGLGMGQLGKEQAYMKASPPSEGDPGILGLILGNMLMPAGGAESGLMGQLASFLQTPKQSKPAPQGSVAPVMPPAPIAPVGVAPASAPTIEPQVTGHPETDYVLKEFLGVK